MRVHVLATCRDDSLLPFTLLVFSTLRTGFPTADIYVDGNGLKGKALTVVTAECERTGCTFHNIKPTIHHLWVERIATSFNDPMVFLDTDMILFESVEGWKFDTALAGWRIPEFNDEFTNARTRARLHTSLLFVDPVKLRAAIAEYSDKYPRTVFNPFANLFHPLCVPFKGGAYFADTCSNLYHAVGGTPFTDRQLEAYHHLFFGTIPDVVLPRLKDGLLMAAARAAIMANPVLGKGQWRTQMKYYEARQ